MTLTERRRQGWSPRVHLPTGVPWWTCDDAAIPSEPLTQDDMDALWSLLDQRDELRSALTDTFRPMFAVERDASFVRAASALRSTEDP